jgi:hypothetical protein
MNYITLLCRENRISNPRKKKHPHYDLMNEKIRKKVIDNGAIFVSDKMIVKFCREFYGERGL